ncbi:MAG: glutathione S-transferase family protein [Alphaproteobacteria bacterium]|nr:glutathione S-transferase family protein [Alphaproteobacteria bacterium]MCW5752238.1 glutathione S-transferase family protein [Alphaproteobacteria bacterium]
MRILYHLWLSPYCRKVRVALKEKGLEFELELERAWERREAFLALNPAGQVPVLVEPDGRAYADSAAICEYLDEAYPDRPLVGFDPPGRAETRRLLAWFDQKFAREVTENLLGEKHYRRLRGQGHPNSEYMRAGQQNLHYHLDYISFLAERRTWLAGDDLSLADIAAAAHLSALDYLGDVPWDEHPGAKDWYARIKSRPSFRPLLADHIPGLPPPRHYADLDF